MTITLSHTTALEALRSPAFRLRLARGERSGPAFAEEPLCASDAEALVRSVPQLSGLARPIEVLASPHMGRTRSKAVRTHPAAAGLSDDCCIPLARGVCCVGPELLALQMAPQLTKIELLVLLGELLGIYAIAPGVEKGMFQRPAPLATPESMGRMLAFLGPASGTARLRWALGHACVGSASPQETKLSLRLGLKPALGGYGLKVLSMNDPVAVERIASKLEKGVRRPDVLLRAHDDAAGIAGVALDYDGAGHLDAQQHAVDLRRQNELLAIGFKDYAIDARLYHDPDYMDALVARIRRDLGMPREHLRSGEALKRRTLRQGLHDELELIDGVNWNGKERATGRLVERTAENDYYDYEQVPLDVYGV